MFFLIPSTARQSQSDDMDYLVGKHILITGGSTGIGLVVIRKCLEHGATVRVNKIKIVLI